MRNVLALVVAAVLLLAGAADAVPVPPFVDGDFSDAGWALVPFTFKSGGGAFPGGSVTAVQEGDGNPGTRRTVTDFVTNAPSATEYATTFGAHLRLAATWNPGTQGAIATLDYQEDAILLVGGGDGQATGLAVRQGGTVYISNTLFTPEFSWTRKRLSGVKSADLYALTADGLDFSRHPDFTTAGAPLELGFFRGNSNSPGGHQYSIVGAIDNWRVQVNPFCTTPADCDDGDACTADTCESGACVHGDPCDDGDACTTDGCGADGTCTYAPVVCDDGKACTADTCSGGTCTSVVTASYAVIEAEVTELIGILNGPACGTSPLVKKLARKLKGKLAKVRARLEHADAATKTAAITRLLGKADALLAAAGALLDAAVTRGDLSSGCRDDLRVFLGDIRACLAGLPRS